jgi:hypothetical protein
LGIANILKEKRQKGNEESIKREKIKGFRGFKKYKNMAVEGVCGVKVKTG